MEHLQCSVIIPVFNEKEGIQEFMTSLYQQTRAPDEIIVIDGGSTDGTYEYLQEQADEKKIIVYRHPSNIAEARNFAVQKAHHDIILCTDA
ncbi:MAG: glycosyltransferase family 2 protein [bacterium]